MRSDLGNQLCAQARSHTWRLQALAEARFRTPCSATKCDQRRHRGQQLVQELLKVVQENRSLRLRWSVEPLAEVQPLGATTSTQQNRGALAVVAVKLNAQQRADSSHQRTRARTPNHLLLTRIELKH